MKGNNDDSLACSHLNICCVHSQNGDHESALRHAMDALAAANNAVRSNSADSTESPLDLQLDVNDPRRKQKLATLCIAYHNTGVELEHLKRYEECLEKYEKALQISEMFLPENREMAASFRQSYKAAKMIAAEHNMAHGRPQIPEKTVKRSKSSQSVRGNGGGRRKSQIFVAPKIYDQKANGHKVLEYLEEMKLLQKYHTTSCTIQNKLTEGILPKVQRSSSRKSVWKVKMVR